MILSLLGQHVWKSLQNDSFRIEDMQITVTYRLHFWVKNRVYNFVIYRPIIEKVSEVSNYLYMLLSLDKLKIPILWQ